MLTLETALRIPTWVLFANVDQEAILLNTQTNQYFSLDEVGARLWDLLKEGKTLRAAHQILLDEYEVEPARLEQDLLELLNDLVSHGLVEISPG